MRRFIPGATLLLGLLACSGEKGSDADSEYGGTLVITTGADFGPLLPPTIRWIHENALVDIVFERLAEPGVELNSVGDRGFTPELARSWEWADDSLSIAFSLVPGAHFHDGHPLTARDVAFTHAIYTDPRVGSSEGELLSSIDSVTVRDSATVVFWFARRYPQQFFDATYHMRIMPEHLLDTVPRHELPTSWYADAPVGSGQFRFVRREAGALVELHADTTHVRGRPYLDRIIWTISPDHEAATTRLLAGDADFLEQVRPNRLAEIRANERLGLKPYPSLDVGFLQFNLRDPRRPNAPHPVLGNRELRRALGMAIDRQAVIARVLDSLGVPAYGPFTRALATADTTIPQLEYDPARARQILDSLGWRLRPGAEIRERSGRPLRFSLISPSSSTTRQQMAVIIQDMLKQVGVRVDLQVMDGGPIMQLLHGKTFDAVFAASHYDPSPSSIRQSWTTAAQAQGGNLGAYSNRAFDRLVDSATTTLDPELSAAQYSRAYRMIVADAPAIWLYEMVNFAGHNARLEFAEFRADAWWANIGEWKIRPGGRLPRDGAAEAAAAN
jgi:peptide/nickel transport system substrate-binding protein